MVTHSEGTIEIGTLGSGSPLMHPFRPDDFKQLLDEVFVISGIIKAEAGNPRPLLFRISQKPNVILMIVSILYIVLKKITTNTPSQGTPARTIYSTE